MVIQTIMNGIKDKALIALFPAGLFVLTETHQQIVAIILWLLIIDTILGVAVALKRKRDTIPSQMTRLDHNGMPTPFAIYIPIPFHLPR